MSKYEAGAYHYWEFDQPDSIYRAHVIDLVEQIAKVAKPSGYIFECGAGEGLILHKLSVRGYCCRGCDIDPLPVALAAKHGNEVLLGEIHDFVGGHYDAVLLCDVLEHVKDAQAVIDDAKRMGDVLVVAVPDRHDRHAVRSLDGNDVLAMVMDGDWEVVHGDQRHARHLLIFRRKRD